jgi:DHA1 family bicyclomycin/chloramphenicol resistance-like MFS transporter
LRSTFIVYFLSFSAFLAQFTQSIYIPILPEMSEAFNTSSFLINLSISIFTVFLAIMQIVYGPLTDKKGRRKVLNVGLTVYTLASIGCFLSESIYIFLLFRAIQGIGIAAGSVVAVTVIGDLFEGKRRAKEMATFQMLITLGPVLGPIIGGFIAGRGDYHYVFLVSIILGLVFFATLE